VDESLGRAVKQKLAPLEALVCAAAGAPGAPPLPFATAELPGSGGTLRASPEDFRVDEVPAYLPSGAGPHLYLRVEKRGRTTPDALRALARALGVPAGRRLRGPEGPRRGDHPVALLPRREGARARRAGGAALQKQRHLQEVERCPRASPLLALERIKIFTSEPLSTKASTAEAPKCHLHTERTCNIHTTCTTTGLHTTNLD